MDSEKFTLDEFESKSEHDWLIAAEKSLKGIFNEYISKMTNYENIPLKPIYNSDNISLPDYIIHSVPGKFPFHRGYSGSLNNLYISQIIKEADLKKVNKILKQLVSDEMSAIYMKYNSVGSDLQRVAKVDSIDDLKILYDDINLTDNKIIIDCEGNYLSVASAILAFLKTYNYEPSKVSINFYSDPLAVWIKYGKGYRNIDEEINEIYAITHYSLVNRLNVKSIGVKGFIFGNAGGSAVEEIALSLGTLLEYIRTLHAKGMKIEDITKSTILILSTDSDFFIQIAKLRAARLLISSIYYMLLSDSREASIDNLTNSENIHKQVVGNEGIPICEIHTISSVLNKSKLDNYINLLRDTGETLASVIGGADTLILESFDSALGTETNQSLRLARNIPLIIYYESGLNEVIDSSGGSWYIESLTDSLARKAFELFQEIEKMGGMKAAIIAGFPQHKILGTAQMRLNNLYTRKDILVGTNAYPLKEQNNYQNYSVKEKTDTYTTNSESGSSITPKKSVQFSESILQNILPDERTYNIRKPDFETSTKIDSKLTSNDFARTMELNRNNDIGIIDFLIEQFKSGATISELEKLFPQSNENNVKPIGELRLSEAYEKIVERAENYKNKYGTAPNAFLGSISASAVNQKKLAEIEDIMYIGGFKVTTCNNIDDMNAEMESIIKDDFKIIVLYTDGQIKEIDISSYSKLIKSRKPDAVVIIACEFDEAVNDLNIPDVDYYIYPSTDIVSLLNKIYDKLGNLI